ncbi:MAG: hypothetical protein GY757_02710 [bacterium]|nr:hypothetical protein [bacterium]
MLSPLDNETIFKAAFTDKTVFKAFVKDIIGIEIEVDKIETEKKFEPKVGNIDFSYDIFAESTDHRVIVEIQKIDYDYNFDRFLHYFIMAIAELQRRAAEYKIAQTVYSVVILTAPYKLDKKTRRTIRDEVLITSVNPRNLQDKIIPLFGHKLIFLNHHFKNKNTPSNYRDWLDLFYESTHNPEKYTLNLENEGIKKAVELIDFEKLSPQQRHNMKIDAQRKVVRRLNQEEGFEKGKKEGVAEGKKEGEKEKSLQTAKLMLANNEPIDKIALYTGLSRKELTSLL